jgi:hypothetical protein
MCVGKENRWVNIHLVGRYMSFPQPPHVAPSSHTSFLESLKTNFHLNPTCSGRPRFLSTSLWDLPLKSKYECKRLFTYLKLLGVLYKYVHHPFVMLV